MRPQSHTILKSSALISNYCILKEQHLIVEYHEGVGRLQNVIEFTLRQAADVEILPEYNVIVDIRNLAFDVSPSDIQTFARFCQQQGSIIDNRRIAYITDTPSQVAATMLFKQMYANVPSSLKVVSTIGAAISWVSSDVTCEQIDAAICDLRLSVTPLLR